MGSSASQMLPRSSCVGGLRHGVATQWNCRQQGCQRRWASLKPRSNSMRCCKSIGIAQVHTVYVWGLHLPHMCGTCTRCKCSVERR